MVIVTPALAEGNGNSHAKQLDLRRFSGRGRSFAQEAISPHGEVLAHIPTSVKLPLTCEEFWKF
jgi:hypothetical protein